MSDELIEALLHERLEVLRAKLIDACFTTDENALAGITGIQLVGKNNYRIYLEETQPEYCIIRDAVAEWWRS